MQIRKWVCDDCGHKFFVDCDDSDYPEFCPFCGEVDEFPINATEQTFEIDCKEEELYA